MRLLWRSLNGAEVFGPDAFPFAGLQAIHVAGHLEALRRMIFVRLRAIGEMESVPGGLIAGLLQQIGTPQRHRAATIESPGAKHARRQIIRAASYNHEDGFSRGHW